MRSRGPIWVVRPSLPPWEEYLHILRPVWTSRILSNNGPLVQRLEAEVGRYLPAPNVSAVTNGTVALQLALRAMGPQKGTVVTTPFTYAATTTSLVWEGFTPRFADIDPRTFNLDPASVDECLGDDAVGVLGVHVFGNSAGAASVAALARSRSRWAVFDAAHSFGARVRGAALFSLGDASTLSFHATKNFHTFEGGAIASPRALVARRVRTLRNFGFLETGDIATAGLNGKMTEAHAAMGLANLRHVDEWIRLRGERCQLYRDLLEPGGEIEFQQTEAGRPNYCYMPILLPSRRIRDRLYRELVARNIHPRRYFYPLTSHFRFAKGSVRPKCPNAERVAGRVLTLPLYPDLPLVQVRRIARIVRETVRG